METWCDYISIRQADDLKEALPWTIRGILENNSNILLQEMKMFLIKDNKRY